MATKIACVHCGFIFEDEDMEVCPVCGTELGQEWNPAELQSFVVTELSAQQAEVIGKLVHKSAKDVSKELAADGCFGLNDLTPVQVETWGSQLKTAGIEFTVENSEQKALRLQKMYESKTAAENAKTAAANASAADAKAQADIARANADAATAAKKIAADESAKAAAVKAAAETEAQKIAASQKAAEDARIQAEAEKAKAEAIANAKASEAAKAQAAADKAAAERATAEAEALKARAEAEAKKNADIAKAAEEERKQAEAIAKANAEAAAKADAEKAKAEADAAAKASVAATAQAEAEKAKAEAKAKTEQARIEAEALKAKAQAEAEAIKAAEAAKVAAAEKNKAEALAKANAEAAAKAQAEQKAAEAAAMLAQAEKMKAEALAAQVAAESAAREAAEKTKQMELEAVENKKKRKHKIFAWGCGSILAIIVLFFGLIFYAGYENEKTLREEARLKADAKAREEARIAAEKKAVADRIAAEKKAEADRIAAEKREIAKAKAREEARIAARERAAERAKKREEARIAAAKKAEADRIAAMKKKEQERIEAKKRAAEAAKKAEEERIAAEKRAAEERTPEGRIKKLLCFEIDGVRFEFVLCPSGKFKMGSPNGEECRKDDESLHTVTLTKPFLIGKYEITQAQFKKVAEGRKLLECGWEKLSICDDNRPVAGITYLEALAFCLILNEKTESIRPKGYYFSLPTEAQWEYACRAGSGSPYSGKKFDDVGWDFMNTVLTPSEEWDASEGFPFKMPDGKTKKGGPHAVGKKRPNAWGIYDMHGNVSEFCNDNYAEYAWKVFVGTSDVTDPCHHDKESSVYVIRGGSWRDFAGGCRAASRDKIKSEERKSNIGLRIVLTSRESE